MRAIALLSVLCTSVCAQSNPTACSLSPGLEKEYLALPSMSDLSLSWLTNKTDKLDARGLQHNSDSSA